MIFYETEVDTGKKSWEAVGVFAPTDVHRQVIVKIETVTVCSEL